MRWRRSASSAGATVDGRIVSEMSANALFFVQWCVFLARVHHRATEAVCVHDVAVAYCGSLAASLPAHLKTAKLRNARRHLSSNYWYFPPHIPPGPPLLAFECLWRCSPPESTALLFQTEAGCHELLMSFREQESRTPPRIWEWGIARRHPSQGKTAAASCSSAANNSNKMLD